MSNEQQKKELFKTIWKIANELRGTVDGWDFKQYVLGMLFYRFISENLIQYVNKLERESGYPDFDYTLLSDDDAEIARQITIEDKGFYILPSELFVNIRKNAKNNEDLNVTIANIFKNIEASSIGTPAEPSMKGLFDDIDVNSNKLGASVDDRNKVLVKLLDSIGELNLGNYQDNSIDVFGDAYEFLMGMYASQAGKSGGEYYTPQEVSELLAKITVIGKTEVNKVYDPACGSGSLLLKFAKVLGKGNVKQGYYGQESNITTYNLCRINMHLHDINYDKFNIAHGDTLVSPKHADIEPFEAIVSNPPYSTSWEGKDNPILINDPRFTPAGVLAPKSKSDLAFTMHILSYLASNGCAAIVEFPGVLYRGGAEQKIRKYLVDNNFVDTVIQLPSDLFFGTSIATCIIVLKKNKENTDIQFIDASKEFVRDGNKNKLNNDNIEKILNAITNKEEIEYFSTLTKVNKIEENDYNLSVNSYLEQKSEKEEIDIKLLNKEIEEIVKKQSQLRIELDQIIKEIEGDYNE